MVARATDARCGYVMGRFWLGDVAGWRGGTLRAAAAVAFHVRSGCS
ncbi:hypothetical protein MYA_4623 [Burkholderia sp. KJ006]|nr:hypothetical protein MYA_4623 [Burkholderia sp. KJ006]